MKKFFIKSLTLTLALVFVISMLSACAPAAAPEEPAAEEPAAEEPAAELRKLVFLPGQLANPSQAFGWKMFQKHGEDYGFEVSVLDGKGDAQEQNKAINNAVAQGVDVMVVNPTIMLPSSRLSKLHEKLALS